MSSIPTELRLHYTIARKYVGRENAERLTDEIEKAVSADLKKWDENEKRFAQDFSPIMKSIVTQSDVTSFIFDHLLPLKMNRRRPNSKGKRHKILDLALALEPDQFVGLVLLYAIRLNDRARVGRALDMLLAPSNPYKQHLKAYRKSSEGGHEKAQD
jgi:hypothetical protein